MTTNISTLALNLLISERLSHRNSMASNIINLLNGLEESSEKEKEVKNAFIAVLHQCIANPNCQSRDLFFQYVEYYGEKIANRERLSSAA